MKLPYKNTVVACFAGYVAQAYRRGARFRAAAVFPALMLFCLLGNNRHAQRMPEP